MLKYFLVKSIVVKLCRDIGFCIFLTNLEQCVQASINKNEKAKTAIKKFELHFEVSSRVIRKLNVSSQFE